MLTKLTESLIKRPLLGRRKLYVVYLENVVKDRPIYAVGRSEKQIFKDFKNAVEVEYVRDL